jgi:hypothetical protein
MNGYKSKKRVGMKMIMKMPIYLSFILVCLMPQLVSAVSDKVGTIMVEGNYKYLVGKLPDGKTKKLKVVDELETKIGVLRAVFERVSYGLEYYVFLDEKRIQNGAGNIYGIYYIGQQPWVLVGANPGGGKNPNRLSFLKINKDKSATEIKYEPHWVFVSYKRKLDVESSGNRLIIDLGFEDQKKKLAILENDKISIEYSVVGLNAVTPEDCRMLYELAKTECTWEFRREDCKKRTIGMIPSSTVYLSTLDHIASKPGFKQDEFDNECYKACESGVISKYEDFSKSACGHSSSN